nr:hypothetical protein [Tanacetum cinerariifolium]
IGSDRDSIRSVEAVDLDRLSVMRFRSVIVDETSNTLHNAIMEAGGKDRPPMLAPGNYVQWRSRIKRYIDTKPNHELIYYCLKNPPYKYTWADKVVPVSEGIDNDIYSTVDACPNACEMWKAIERGKAIVNSPPPIYDQEPSMVAEDDEMSQDKEIDKLMALISLSFNKIYKPTNNNLRTSSNTSNVAEARETVDEHNVIIDSLDMSYDREQIDHNDDDDDDDDLANERELLASLIEKLKYEIDDSKNHNKFLETSNKILVDKLKGEIEDFKTKNKSLESSNKHFKEANNKLSEINALMYNDLKKFQAEDVMMRKMKKELFAHQETISILSQAKEAHIKLYKTREDKELDKVIALENKVKVLDNIVYKTGQSVQTMNMLNPPESEEVIRLEKESRSKLSNLIRPFDYDKLNNLYDLFVSQREKLSEQRYFSERSRMSHTHVNNGNSKESFNKQATLLEKRMDESIPYDQKCKSSKELFKIKRSIGTIFDGVVCCKETISKRTYFGHIVPFIQNTIEANFCLEIQRINADLKKFHLCLKEEMVADLRYFNSLELEVDSLKSQLETQKTQFLNEINRPSREYYYTDHMNAILGVYTELDEVTNLQCDYLEMLEKCECLEKELSKSKMMSKTFEALQKHAINLEIDLQQCQEKITNDKSFKENQSKEFRKEREQYFEIQDLKAQLQDKGIAISELKKLIEKLKGKSVDTKFEKSSVIRQPNAFKSQRPTILGKPTIFSDSLERKDFSKSNLKVKTSNVNFVCATCGKCVLNDKHDMCVLKSLDGMNSRTKMPIAVPVSTREPKRTVKQSVAKPLRKIVASESNQKPRNITRKLYEHLVEIILFIIDSGCLKHMMGNLKLLTNYVEKFLGTMKFGNDQIAPILGYRDLVQGAVTIKRVYYVEGVNHNLFFISQFCDADLEVAFRKSTCYIRDLKGNDLLTSSSRIDLYSITLQDTSSPNPCFLMAKATSSQAWLWHRRLSYLNFDTINLLSKNDIVGNDLLTSSSGIDLYSITLQDTSSPNPCCLMAKATSSQAWLWHRRLSYLNFDTINLLSKNDIVVGLSKLKFVKDHLCSSFELGKAKLKSFQSKTTPSSKRRYTWTHFLRSKDETPVVLIDFLRLVQRGLHAQSRAYREFNKRTRVIVETIHVNFDELPQMASDHVSSDSVPQCQNMTLEHDSLSLGLQCQENVPHATGTVTTSNELDLLFSLMFDELLNGSTQVVSKSSAETTADSPIPCQQQHTTPLNTHTTTEPTCQVPTQALTVQDRGETSSRYVDSSNMHTFYQRHPSEYCWTKDHPLEQVIGNPSQSVRTRRQLESDGEMCMFALTVSRTEPKNIKEAMADSAWIESMQEELHQFDRLDVWELVDRPLCKNVINMKWL